MVGLHFNMPEGETATGFITTGYIYISESVTDRVAISSHIVVSFLFHLLMICINFKLAMNLPDYFNFVQENITYENPQIKAKVMKFVYKVILM